MSNTPMPALDDTNGWWNSFVPAALHTLLAPKMDLHLSQTTCPRFQGSRAQVESIVNKPLAWRARKLRFCQLSRYPADNGRVFYRTQTALRNSLGLFPGDSVYRRACASEVVDEFAFFGTMYTGHLTDPSPERCAARPNPACLGYQSDRFATQLVTAACYLFLSEHRLFLKTFICHHYQVSSTSGLSCPLIRYRTPPHHRLQ